jgi:hypothetical protein
MSQIHCDSCGGFITDPAVVSYRLPDDGAVTASPHTALCACTPAIIYGPPPGWVSGSHLMAT